MSTNYIGSLIRSFFGQLIGDFILCNSFVSCHLCQLHSASCGLTGTLLSISFLVVVVSMSESSYKMLLFLQLVLLPLVSLLFQWEMGSTSPPPSNCRALHKSKTQIRRMLLGALRVSFVTLWSPSQCHAVFSVRLTLWHQWTRSILTDVTPVVWMPELSFGGKFMHEVNVK
jgi:hypothetical protein